MAKTITLELRPEDAEPILRQAADDAAKFGAWVDYIDRRTYDSPKGRGETLEEAKKRWRGKFLAAKRIVEAFGVDYEPTSEEEALGVYFHYVGGSRKLKKIGGIAFNVVTGSRPDFSNPHPQYRKEIHAEACRQAADRVVRRWRAIGAGDAAAA